MFQVAKAARYGNPRPRHIPSHGLTSPGDLPLSDGPLYGSANLAVYFSPEFNAADETTISGTVNRNYTMFSFSSRPILQKTEVYSSRPTAGEVPHSTSH